MSQTGQIQKYLEVFLDKEGIYSIIPESRRKSIFSLSTAGIAFTIILIAETLLLSSYTSTIAFIPAIIFVISSFIFAFLVVLIPYIIIYIRTKSALTDKQTSTMGGLAVIVWGITIVVVNYVYLDSWVVVFSSFLYVFLGLLAAVVVNGISHRVYVLFGIGRSVLKNAVQSFRLIFVILPIMLVLLLFSVFSADFWQAIGNISWVRLLTGTGLLVLPILFLTYISVPSISRKIIQDSTPLAFLSNALASIPEIRQHLDEGTIGIEEWQEALEQIEWRHRDKLLIELSFIERKTTRTLTWLLLFTSILLLLTFSFYFYLLFTVLVNNSQISVWTGINLTDMILQTNILQWTLNINIPLVKVSIFLAIFVSIVTVVQSVTDENFQGMFVDQVKSRATNWISASALYLSIVYPDYQIWEFIRNPKNNGIINGIIVVRKGLTDTQIREVCERLEQTITGAYHFLHILAYEKNEERPEYRAGVPGRKWIYIHNITNNITSFYDNHSIVDDEPSTNHMLGEMCLENGIEPPTAWFSSTQEGVEIGSAFWNNDRFRPLILHPRISYHNKNVVAHIHIRKRLATSKEYRSLVVDMYHVIRNSGIEVHTLMLSLLYRDTMDRLASLSYYEPIMTYYDEISNKSEYLDPSEWQ